MTRPGEDAMTKTFARAVWVLGLLCASIAANAGITFTDIYVQQNYYQTGAGTYVDLMSSPLAGLSGPGGNAKIQFMVGVLTPSDFTSITVSGPGFGSAQVLGAPALDGGQWQATYTDEGFASLAALNSKYPSGSTYTFTATATNPSNNQVRTNPFTNIVPTSSPGGAPIVPLLTGASFASLQGLNAGLANFLAFNTPFYGSGPETNLELAIFNVATVTAVYASGFQPATTTGLLIPANTLAANTDYVFALGYHVFDGSHGGLEFETYSFGEFRTAAAVPEPAAMTLLGVGFAGLGFWRRRKRAVSTQLRAS
jgi:hypothetical protein